MTWPDSRHDSRRWLPVIIGVTALTSFIKLVLALTTFGTNDVATWRDFLFDFQYYNAAHLWLQPRVGFNYFNHPPFMVHVLQALGWLTAATGLPFSFWLRLPAIVADVGSVALLWKLTRFGTASPLGVTPLGVALVAMSPISLLVSGFHGNTDAVMVFFLLLAVFWLTGFETSAALRFDAKCSHKYFEKYLWLSGVAFGMSLNIKIVPLMLLPLFWWQLRDNRQRAVFFGTAAAVWLLASCPYLLEVPSAITQRTFGYNSLHGQWGLSCYTEWLWPGQPINKWIARNFKYPLFLLILGVSWWLNHPRRAGGIFRRCGAVMFLFMTLSPGFGVQYLAWLVPWTAGIRWRTGLLLHATGGVFLFLIYNYWARGLPWYYADSDAVGDWRGAAIACEVLCWLSVALVAISYFLHHRKRPELKP